MKRYRVTVCRDRRETCRVEVEASDERQAEQEALVDCLSPTFVGWQVDDSDECIFIPENGVVELGSASS